MWYVLAIIGVLGVPFTLWWWRVADAWASAEHKRFKPRKPPIEDRIVVVEARAGEENEHRVG